MDATHDSISSTAPMSTLASSGRASAATVIRMGLTWVAGCRTVSEIIAEAAKAHFYRTATVYHTLGQTRSMTEAAAIQRGYFRTTADHSLDSAKQLFQAADRIKHEIMSPIFVGPENVAVTEHSAGSHG